MSMDFLINLTPTEFRLRPEEQTKIRLTIYNQSDKFQSYQLVIEGVGKDWLTFDRKYMSALPKQETEEAWLTLKPLADAPGGNYNLVLKVIATSEGLPDVQQEAKLPLEVIAPKETAPGGFTQSISSSTVSTATASNKLNQVAYPTTLNLKARILPGTEAKPEPPTAFSWEVEVKNDDIQDRIINYSLCVVGLPATWSRVEPAQLPLNSKESGKLRLVVQPGDSAPAGTYNFMLRVYSQLNPQERVEIPCRFQIDGNNFNKPFVALPKVIQQRNGPLEIKLSERNPEVRPGQETPLEVNLTNYSQTKLTLVLRVSGLPNDWYELANSQLEAGPGQSIRLQLNLQPPAQALPGSYTLALQAQALQDPDLNVKLVAAPEIIDYLKSYSPKIRLELEPEQPTINFDQETSLNLTVHNQSARHDVYSLKVEGAGFKPEWVKVEQPNPQIPPFGKTKATLKLRVPLEAGIVGAYPLQIKAFSDVFSPEIDGTATCFLQAPVVGGYSLVVSNNKVNAVKEATYQLEVSNQANAPLYLKLSGAENTSQEASSLIFRFTPAQLEVPPQSKAQVTLVVSPRYRADSDISREFEIKSEGYYLLSDHTKQNVPAKVVSAIYLQEAAPTLIINLEPGESETDQVAVYDLRASNPSNERVRLQFSATATNNQLNFVFDPAELIVNPKEFGKTNLTVTHRQKAASSEPKTYNFQVQAKYAGEGLAPVMPGLENGRFIHVQKAAKKFPWLAIAGALVATLAIGAAVFAFLPKNSTQGVIPAVSVTPAPITTAGDTVIAQVTTAQPVTTLALPTTANPQTTAANPTTANPQTTAANPTTANPQTTTANPQTTTANPKTTTANPQTTTAVTPKFAVTKAEALVTPASGTTCPTTFNFTGNLTANAAGNVTYRWERSDNAQASTQTLSFSEPGTKAVTDSWSLGASYSGWQRLHILTPNDLVSNQANFTLNCPAPAKTLNTPFSLVDNRTVYYLALTAPGQIQVKATWSGSQGNLALIINGPGQEGYYARKDGASGVSTNYTVSAADFAKGKVWRVTLASFGTGEARGKVQLTYPSGATAPAFEEDFVVTKNYSTAVNVLVVKQPGLLEGQATWTGNPASLAMIINGPGQVSYYARQDTKSPLKASYNVTANDLKAGEFWRLSVTSFAAADLEGNLTIKSP